MSEFGVLLCVDNTSAERSLRKQSDVGAVFLIFLFQSCIRNGLLLRA